MCLGNNVVEIAADSNIPSQPTSPSPAADAAATVVALVRDGPLELQRALEGLSFDDLRRAQEMLQQRLSTTTVVQVAPRRVGSGVASDTGSRAMVAGSRAAGVMDAAVGCGTDTAMIAAGRSSQQHNRALARGSALAMGHVGSVRVRGESGVACGSND